MEIGWYRDFLREQFSVNVSDHLLSDLFEEDPQLKKLLDESSRRRQHSIRRSQTMEGDYDHHDGYFKEYEPPAANIPYDSRGRRIPHAVAFVRGVARISRKRNDGEKLVFCEENQQKQIYLKTASELSGDERGYRILGLRTVSNLLQGYGF
jgi:hypothetical protein